MKKIWAILFVLMLAMSLMTVALADPATGGTDGGIDWKIENGTLTISAANNPESGYTSGVMKDYNNDQPWYSGRESITNVILEEGITHIGKKAFWGFGDNKYNNILSLTVPSTLESVGQYWFALGGLTSVSVGAPAQGGETSVKVNDNVLFLGDTLLISANKTMTSYTVPANVTKIGDAAFYKHTALTSVTLSETTQTYGGYAFIDCSSLASINFEAYKGSVVPTGFFYGTAITEANLPANINEIGTSSFFDCKNLTSVSLTGVDQKIDTNAFAGCSQLASITLTNKIATGKEDDFFGDGCFSGTAITTITLPENATKISKKMFSNCVSLQDVVSTSGSLTSIGEDAFFKSNEPQVTCANFKGNNLNLENVTAIGQYAFRGTAIETIKLKSITTIGNRGIDSAAIKVLDLSEVTSAPTWGDVANMFNSSSGNVTIYATNADVVANIKNNASLSSRLITILVNGGTVDTTKTGFAAVSKLGKVAKWYEYSESATNNFGDPAPAAPAANKTYIAEWIDSVYTVPATLELDAFTEGATPVGKELPITLNDGETAGAGDLTAVSDSPAAITAAVADGKVTVTAASGLTAGNYGAVVTVTTQDGAVHKVTVTLTVNAKPASRPTTTPSTNNTIQSPKTFDAGIAVYGVMALTSAAGAVYVTKKHH